MKKLALILVGCLTCASAHATWPHNTKTVSLANGTIVAKLDPFRSQALAIVDAKGATVRSFHLAELISGITTNQLGEVIDCSEAALDEMNWSSAGCWWYENSIAFVDASESFLIIRLSSQRTITVDLAKQSLLPSVPVQIQKEVADTIRTTAIRLLGSSEAKDRETGAIMCGQLRVEEAIPRLKELLTDPAAYLCEYNPGPSGHECAHQYIVRRAAVFALLQMDVVTIGHVVLDEPDPEAAQEADERMADLERQDELKARAQKEAPKLPEGAR